MEADELHHVNVRHVGHVRIVGRTRREVGADRTGKHRSSGAGRLNARAEHHRNQRGTDGCRAAGS